MHVCKEVACHPNQSVSVQAGDDFGRDLYLLFLCKVENVVKSKASDTVLNVFTKKTKRPSKVFQKNGLDFRLEKHEFLARKD